MPFRYRYGIFAITLSGDAKEAARAESSESNATRKSPYSPNRSFSPGLGALLYDVCITYIIDFKEKNPCARSDSDIIEEPLVWGTVSALRGEEAKID